MEILLERIKNLCKSKSITVSILEDKLDLPTNTIYQWKKRIPNTERLQLVADFFNVSVDYLLGRTDNPDMTPDQKRELSIKEALDSVMTYDGKPLSDNDREILRGIIEGYLDNK